MKCETMGATKTARATAKKWGKDSSEVWWQAAGGRWQMVKKKRGATDTDTRRIRGERLVLRTGELQPDCHRLCA